MTGQSLLDRMEILNQELQLQAGEADVTRGLLALNMAQDYFESVAALRPKILGSTTGTVTTAASTESTTFPTGLLRIDSLWKLNDTTSLPDYKVTRVSESGGHTGSLSWPFNLYASPSSGAPKLYETGGGVIWWNPLPDGTYTIRWYGFQAAADITASGTFAYPDVVALPLSAFACKLLKLGIDDPINEMQTVAVDTFTTVLDTLSLFNRDGAQPLEYTQVHLT